NHFNFFPLSLGKFIASAKIQEIHFSLTKGFWRNNIWGYAVRDAPSGAELSVLFQRLQDNPSKAWREVTSTLSGHFCASLNFIDKAATVQPVYSFRPEGVTFNGSVDNNLLFYAALPHEAVCTENLTPWKKMLPCFDKAGLSSLLNAKHLFNSHYFSLALDFKPICETQSCKRTQMQLTQSVSVVFNPTVVFDGKKSWSLIKLFGTPLKQSCDLASESSVLVDITRNDSSNPHAFTSQPTDEITETFGDEKRKFAVFDVKKLLSENKDKQDNKLNIVSLYKKPHTYWVTVTPPVHASRYITGYGVSEGGISCHIYNKLSQNVSIIYMDVIPWYLRIYIHTLKITVSRDLQTTGRSKKVEPDAFYYKPALDRTQPHHIEIGLTLLPN
ncbi:GPI transamidase component PIG-T-like protein, partial [Leptotrombidium deliense]